MQRRLWRSLEFHKQSELNMKFQNIKSPQRPLLLLSNVPVDASPRTYLGA